jgi:hypothetical protein
MVSQLRDSRALHSLSFVTQGKMVFGGEWLVLDRSGLQFDVAYGCRAGMDGPPRGLA